MHDGFKWFNDKKTMVLICDEETNYLPVGNKMFWNLASHAFKNSSLAPRIGVSEQRPLLSVA